MLNIYYGGEQTDREKFIFEHMKGNTLLLVPEDVYKRQDNRRRKRYRKSHRQSFLRERR